MNMQSPFVWGQGGVQLTPDQIAAQRRVADAMMARGGDYSPVESGWQGAARLAEGLVGGLRSSAVNVAEQRNAAAEKELLGSFLGGGAPTAPMAAPAASPSISAPMGAAPIPAGVSDAGLSDAIAKVAAARGVDPSYMTRLAMVESGGNVNAANPNSSARGPFQFINSTAKQYGLTNPSDPAASADAAARLTLDNKAALTAALGRDPTPGELYLAHQQGAGGASKILGNPNAPIESVVGGEAARLNGAKPGMTAGQFAEKWTGKFADMGGAQQAASAAPAGVNPKLIQAYASPYVSEGTKKVLGMMLQQQMKPADTTDDIKEYQFAKREDPSLTFDKFMQRKKSVTGEYSLNPVYGTDASGNTVLLQTGKGGEAIQTKLPPGVKISNGFDKIDLGTEWGIMDKRTGQMVGRQPKDIAGKEVAEERGKARGQAEVALPGVLANAEQTLKVIGEIKNDPYRQRGTGGTSVFNRIPGTGGYDFQKRVDQLKGKTFLEAFQSLKGGGAITEMEGKKAEDAIARLDVAQSEEAFLTALNDLEQVVQSGMGRARQKAGIAEPAATAPVSAPSGVDPKVWSVMTPEERSLWK